MFWQASQLPRSRWTCIGWSLLADLCTAWSGRGTECDEADWRSRRVSCYPIGDKHVVEEKQLKKILRGTWWGEQPFCLTLLFKTHCFHMKGIHWICNTWLIIHNLQLTKFDKVGYCLLSSQGRVTAFVIEHQQDIQEGFNTEALPLSLDRPTQEQGFQLAQSPFSCQI